MEDVPDCTLPIPQSTPASDDRSGDMIERIRDRFERKRRAMESCDEPRRVAEVLIGGGIQAIPANSSDSPAVDSPYRKCALCEDRGRYLIGKTGYCSDHFKMENARLNQEYQRNSVADHPAEALVRLANVPGWLAEEVALEILREPIRTAINSASLDDGIYFWGADTGSGKSLAAAHMALRQLRAGRRVLWTNMYKLLESLRDCYDTNRREEDYLRTYRAAGVLILDDIGVQDRDHERLVLYGILEHRRGPKVTYATGNYGPTPTVAGNGLTVPSLAEMFDDRVQSRLLGLCEPLRIDCVADFRVSKWEQAGKRVPSRREFRHAAAHK